MQEYNKHYDFEKARNIADYITHINVIFDTLKTRFTERKYTPEITQALLPKFNQADYAKGFYELKDLLHLPELPHSIDCFDISHFQSVALLVHAFDLPTANRTKINLGAFLLKHLQNKMIMQHCTKWFRAGIRRAIFLTLS